MFFSTYVLTKKGPLAKVWLAAHWDRRLTRHEVKVVDLNQTILHIVRPVVPIALRTSGELLVGVVRIYVLKVKHLLKEATEATLLLRVTTTTTAKGSHAGTEKAGEKDGASASGGIDAEKATTMDGVLLRGKGDAEAVTFNWSDEVAAKHGSMPDAAESLQGARFDAIADLLGAQQVSGLNQEDGLLAQAWYTVEPSSQAVEELHNTQQDYDEIAKMRADLMAFGDRASGSGSKSKSSLSSIEKGRGSVLPMGPGDEVPFPAVGEELDIGVPAPEDLASNMPLIGGTQGDLLSGGAGLPEDPFTIPDVLTGAAARPERKVRPVNVLDLAATTLPREVFEKYMADRSDVVCAEPRRGPLDEQEEADRYTIACDAHPADAAALARLSGQTSTATSAAHESAGAASLPLSNAALLSAQPNPTLRASFAFMLQQQVAEAVEEAAAVARASLSPMAGRRSDGALAGPHEEEEGGDVAAAAEAAEREAEMQRTARKRAREEAENDDPRSLSTNAVQTLQRIRAEALRVSRRKMRVEAMPEGLVGAGCTLSAVCKGLHRREAARTFVDVLALASKQLVQVHQEAVNGEVEIRLQQSSASVPVS